jgi:hypothetical protein
MSLSLQRTFCVLVCAALRIPFTHSHETPAARIEFLNRSLDHARAVRLTTSTERFVVDGAHADSLGLRWTRRVDAPLEDSLSAHALAWREVVAVEVSKSAWTKEARRGGAWAGSVAFVGTTVVALAAGQDIDSLTLGILAGSGGYLLGWTTGATIGAFHRDWRMVYPWRQGWFGQS